MRTIPTTIQTVVDKGIMDGPIILSTCKQSTKPYRQVGWRTTVGRGEKMTQHNMKASYHSSTQTPIRRARADQHRLRHFLEHSKHLSCRRDRMASLVRSYGVPSKASAHTNNSINNHVPGSIQFSHTVKQVACVRQTLRTERVKSAGMK